MAHEPALHVPIHPQIFARFLTASSNSDHPHGPFAWLPTIFCFIEGKFLGSVFSESLHKPWLQIVDNVIFFHNKRPISLKEN